MCNRLHCRKLLVRAVELLQLVWETLRCGLYDDEIINLHVDPDAKNVFVLLNNLVFERAPLLRAFPEELTTKLPRELCDILLSCAEGREALFWTGRLVKQLLKGMPPVPDHALQHTYILKSNTTKSLDWSLNLRTGSSESIFITTPPCFLSRQTKPASCKSS